ncbi:MAG: glutaredoxin family protein [Bdellovibrionales bacterium]|nr:glutaredoxin family protein [Bdellovibrionales bacterium]
MPFLRKFAGPLLTVAVAYGVFLGLQRQTPVVGGSAEQAPEVVGLDATKMYRDLGGNVGEVPVVLFVTDWCAVCRALESDLSAKGVSFVRANVEQDRTALLYYRSITQSAEAVVPVTMVGSKRFVGYQPGAILNAIAALRMLTSAQAV